MPSRLHNLPLVTLGLALLAALLIPLVSPAAAQGRGPVYSVAVDDVVSRYTVGYLQRAIGEAEAAQAEALIIRLGTGGAVLRDVRELAATIAGATIPVVVYVAPDGTSSGAAGLWLLSSAQLAAMAPGTSFGVASPLIESDPSLSEPARELLRSEAIQQLEGWQRERNRGEAWVEQAVREGVILNNEQAVALTPPAVDLVAPDLASLLTTLHGRVVTLESGEQRTLATLGRTPQPLPPTLWEQLLLILASPTVAFLLLVMAGIAIYAELATPTVGVLAGLALVLLLGAIVGLVALPVRWLALAGLLLAFAIISADLYVPSHGAFTVVGLVLLIVSSLGLFDAAQAPGVTVAYWAIALVAALVAAFAALGIYLAVRTRNRPVATGQESLVGQLAEVRSRLDPEGFVFVEGALWRAISEEGDVEQGEWVRVTGIHALRLTVRRLAAEPASPDVAPV